MARSGPWTGCYSSKRFGARHSCTAQLLAWPEVLHEGQACNVPAKTEMGDRPQLTVLETVAPFPHKSLWASGFKSQTGAPRAKPARGALLALFVCWPWLAHSLLGPGSPSLPTGTEISVACTYRYRCRTEGEDPRVRQAFWHLKPPAGTGPG